MVFAGRLQRAVHLPGALAAEGFDVDVLDAHPLVGGRDHDVLGGGIGDGVLQEVEGRRYDGVWIATPCSPYSIWHVPQLYYRSDRGAPPEWRHLVRQTDALAAFTAKLITAAEGCGALWALENPADRGVEGSVAWWPAFADHFPLWLQPAIAAALRAAEAQLFTFAFCALGADVQKWTTVAACARFAARLGFLRHAGCPHGTRRHDQVASGRDEKGEDRARLAGEYPALMCTGVARAAADELLTSPRSLVAVGVAGEGGLDASVAARVEELRRVPPAFASLSNLRELPSEALQTEPLPPSLILPSRLGRRRRRARRRPPLPRQPQPEGLEGWQLPEREGHGVARPEGKISIRQLFLPGVYDEVVETWWPLVDAAKRAIDRRLAGDDVTVPKVPTRVIEEWQRPLWARGDVWDCADPTDCKPVERSSAATPDAAFPGRRKLSRVAVREAARRLGWHDDDIVDQVCGGGVEARSSCERLTVLSFHHPGLLEEFGAAAKVVAAHQEEAWVAPPVRHLPYVPCRLQPRDVIMQDRYRVLEGERDGDGRPKVEAYMKPRVTTNSSHGGEHSVNAGVADDAKRVELPCVQWLARALAICDEAGWASVEAVLAAGGGDAGDRRARAGGGDERRHARAQCYCVDAESAYSFCPVQHADLWTQGFVWWDGDGQAGVCVDRRMGFGGAFAPNRFERVSTLVAAYVRLLQDEFDADEPPALAAEWMARRAGEQPTYRMVFIDDFAGCALDDRVAQPAMVEGIVIEPEATEAAGGTFAPAGTRVHVHAQLAVYGLRQMGFEASPGKVTVGDGVTVLGFGVQSAGRRLVCPPLKRRTLLHQIEGLERSTLADSTVEGKAARRLVGRLNNLSQVFPEVAAYMHGGYTATSARVGGALLRTVRMGAEGRTRADWLELLAVSRELLEANEGVPLAPDLVFPSHADAGVARCVTDASGSGGVGGYVTFSERPGHVWIVCEPWRGGSAEARAEADREVAARSDGAAALSMPAAELFGSWAVARAAAEAAGVEVDAVIAVTDCMPAACALNRAAGGRVPQMRELLRGARRWVTHWLGVHVPRELNEDADVLSHAGGAPAIVAKAREAGLEPHVVALGEGDWAALMAAARLGTGDGTGRQGGRGSRHGKRHKATATA